MFIRSSMKQVSWSFIQSHPVCLNLPKKPFQLISFSRKIFIVKIYIFFQVNYSDNSDKFFMKAEEKATWD